ncbi:MAG: PAS domain-containing protein [Opitutaceae bacterium]|nr:PAS domain-containing protein [Opitutaceae bacterium]
MFNTREYRLAGLLLALGAALIAMGWALRTVFASLGADESMDAIGWSLLLASAAVAGVAFAGASAWKRRGDRRAARQQVFVADDPGVCAVAINAEGVVAGFGTGAERMFGLSRAEAIGRTRLDATVENGEVLLRVLPVAEKNRGTDAEERLTALIEACTKSAPAPGWRAIHRDGTTVPLRGTLSVFQGRRRRPEGALLAASDTSAELAAMERASDLAARAAKIAPFVPGALFQLRQDRDGNRTLPFVTEGARRVFRHLPAEGKISPEQMWATIHPDDAERFSESLARSAATTTRWECEYRVRQPDGAESWLRSEAMPEPGADGAIVWHGFTSDVSDCRRAEQAHEESRVLLQSVFSSVELGVFVVEVEGDDFRYADINPAYERLTGLAAVELRGRGPRSLPPLISAQQAEALCASFRRGLESAGPLEYEEAFQSRGRSLWLLTRLTPLRDPAGRVVRLVGRSLDITERKTIELRFQSLTERLQLATEAAQVGIWDHDFVQGRLMWDSRMHTLYGIAPRDFDSTFADWLRYVHPQDRERIAAEHRAAVEGTSAFNTSFRIVRPDGRERHIRARAHVQRGSTGRAARMVGVNWDVTAERRAQAEIEKARDQAEILNRQLEEALDRAQRLAQEAAAATVAKSEFLANMSHEIRTPLNAVLGMSSVLLGTELTSEQREFAETIRASGDGLLELLNDILDYSKIESGRLDLESRRFDVRECVESALDVLAARAAEKKIDLICELADGVPARVRGDDTRLRQIVVNLLSNAVKFTAEGQVLLSVAVVERTTAGRRLRFSVHDSGIGIPPERMDRLFKSFSQVDASTTRQYGGTGLGLAICKRIVELMGGRIWAESVPGQGSTFAFEVELGEAAETAAPFNRARSMAGRHVLVVDDNPIGRRVLAHQCAAWGFTVRAVCSGTEALAALADGTPCDLAIVDADMPVMGGTETVALIRRRHVAAVLPIVMLVRPGHARPEGDSGVTAHVSRPVKVQPLFDAIMGIFHGRPAAPVAAATDDAAVATGHPLRILLAEDNPVNQRVATLMLRRMGYLADVAANGREAVAAVLGRTYDLVLMDVQMPEMDGLEATREICGRLAPANRPRIVAMTANASTSDRDQCLAAGMDDFLPKPVRQGDLKQALLATPARVLPDSGAAATAVAA